MLSGAGGYATRHLALARLLSAPTHTYKNLKLEVEKAFYSFSLISGTMVGNHFPRNQKEKEFAGFGKVLTSSHRVRVQL